MPNRVVIDSPAVQVRVYVALTVLHTLLVWILPYFPTQDGPSHMYNLVILHDLVNGGREWGAYFTRDFRAVPNLGFLVFSYPFMQFFSPFAVERIFLTLYILLMTTSVPLCIRAFGNRPFPLSFLVFPVLFNYTVMMGFYSFSIAVPCMMLAIAVAWSQRAQALPKLVFLSTIMGIILFYLHLIPFIIYLVFLSIMPLAGSEDHRKPLERLFRLVSVITPLVALFSTYYFNRPPASTSSLQQLLTPDHLLELAVQLLLFSVNSFSKWQILPWIFLFPLFYLLFKSRLKEYVEMKSIPGGQRAVLLLAAFLTACYFILPDSFAGGSFFNARLPWVIFLVFLPLLKVPQTGFLQRMGFVPFTVTALVFLLVNGTIFYQQSSMVQEFLGGLRAEIPKGSIIATYKTRATDFARVDALIHAASYYGMEKKCVNAGNYEVASILFPVHFRSSLPKLPPASLIAYLPSCIDWEKYPSIQYLLGWKVDMGSRARLEKLYAPVMDGKSFSLWKRY